MLDRVESSVAALRFQPSQAFRLCLPHFMAACVFTGAINLLYLAAPLYALHVYDRVLPSRSVSTLAVPTIGLVIALLAMAVLDAVRAGTLVRAGTRLDTVLSAKILTVLIQRRERGGQRQSEALRDLDQVRMALSGASALVVFDAPWTPAFLALLYVLHPVLGWMGVAAALALLGLALLTDRLLRRPLAVASSASACGGQSGAMLRNAEPILATDLQPALGDRWLGNRGPMIERDAAFGAVIRFLRVLLQSAMLGAGAWLAVERQISPASIVVAMVLMGRAVAPVEQSVGAGRQIMAARGAWLRITDLLAESTPAPQTTRSPAEGTSASRSTRPPASDGTVSVEEVWFAPRKDMPPIVRDLTVRLQAGEALGIIGPSAAGKSTLVRLMTGALTPTRGHVRLSGADIRHCDRTQLRRMIGYLPQDVGLLVGSIRDTIARFGTASDEEIVAAARRADVHEMILDLPRGYDTPIGDGGVLLSGGQRQRLRLARALLGKPRLLVLDEPNANLDGDGEASLKEALLELKAGGATIVIVAHRPGIVDVCDTMMVLQDGAALMTGPRLEVLDAVRRQFVRAVTPADAAEPAMPQGAAGPGPSSGPRGIS